MNYMFKFGDHYWIPGRPDIKVSRRDDPRYNIYRKKDIQMNDKTDEVVETHVVDQPAKKQETDPGLPGYLKRTQEDKPA